VVNMTTADILSLPDSPQKRAMLQQLKVPTPDPTPVPLRQAGKKRGVMNKLEQKFSLHLEAKRIRGDIEFWRYEPIRIRLADGAWYTPDFLVITNDGRTQVFETKGFWREAARVRIKVAADKFRGSGWEFLGAQYLKGAWVYERF
jgi:hypothetical protein